MRTQDLFEACAEAVRSHFLHLSTGDIMAPPHAWFDAALARQIALHLMHRQFDVPRRRLSQDLDRGRAGVRSAIVTVDERLAASDDFRCAYSLMALRAKDSINPVRARTDHEI